MIDSKSVRKHLLGGKPTKYDEEIHLNLLVDVFCDGTNASIAKFCAEALIDKMTFHNWKKTHPRFKDAYNIVINIAEAKMEDLPFTTSTSEFNHPSWFLMMKNKFGFGKPTIDFSSAKTPQERLEVIWESLRHGDLNIDEANKLTNLVSIQADVGHGEEAMKKIMTREEQLELLAKYDKSGLGNSTDKC